MEKPRILLIEDCSRGMSPTFSQLAFTRQFPACLNLAANLYDATNRLRNGGFSLVLLSLRLPDCQGVETLRRFQKTGANVPVVALLQDDEWHLEKEVRALGAAAVYSPGKVNGDEVLKHCGNPCDPLIEVEAAPENEPASEVAIEDLGDAVSVEIDAAAPAAAEEKIPEENLPEKNLPAENIPPEKISAAAPTIALDKLEALTVEIPALTLPAKKSDAETAATVASTPAIKEITVEKTVEKIVAPVVAEPAVAPIAPIAPIAAVAAAAPIAATAEETVEEATRREEIVRLRKEVFQYRAARQEMVGVNKALEERCRELEAGQAALIEAEHVAIERERAAREQAEQRAVALGEEKIKEVAIYRRRVGEVEEQAKEGRKQLAALSEQQNQAAAALAQAQRDLAAARAKEQELSGYRQRADLFEKQNRALETQLAAAIAEKEALAAAPVAPAEPVAPVANKETAAPAEYVALKDKFTKLERTYHQASAEKKNAEKSNATLSQENEKLKNEIAALIKKLKVES
ncbi:hypothetical protein FACS1894139_03830 [Planctomycetales bacterium]|nr:hypothetical protein FACS1894107_14190 [Planctomycetales bacterium]GHS97651.1 hypothetical protein FACS1894108_04390 [Planctomycetales bacterium]GHT03468.1 hypothetical protein FACS1894139_03830 [Planctomycetales bacterium]